MEVVERKPVPIYEVQCWECQSKIHYKNSDVRYNHITCPVCNTLLWAMTITPVKYENAEEQAYLENKPKTYCEKYKMENGE